MGRTTRSFSFGGHLSCSGLQRVFLAYTPGLDGIMSLAVFSKLVTDLELNGMISRKRIGEIHSRHRTEVSTGLNYSGFIQALVSLSTECGINHLHLIKSAESLVDLFGNKQKLRPWTKTYSTHQAHSLILQVPPSSHAPFPRAMDPLPPVSSDGGIHKACSSAEASACGQSNGSFTSQSMHPRPRRYLHLERAASLTRPRFKVEVVEGKIVVVPADAAEPQSFESTRVPRHPSPSLSNGQAHAAGHNRRGGGRPGVQGNCPKPNGASPSPSLPLVHVLQSSPEIAKAGSHSAHGAPIKPAPPSKQPPSSRVRAPRQHVYASQWVSSAGGRRISGDSLDESCTESRTHSGRGAKVLPAVGRKSDAMHPSGQLGAPSILSSFQQRKEGSGASAAAVSASTAADAPGTLVVQATASDCQAGKSGGPASLKVLDNSLTQPALAPSAPPAQASSAFEAIVPAPPALATPAPPPVPPPPALAPPTPAPLVSALPATTPEQLARAAFEERVAQLEQMNRALKQQAWELQQQHSLLQVPTAVALSQPILAPGQQHPQVPSAAGSAEQQQLQGAQLQAEVCGGEQGTGAKLWAAGEVGLLQGQVHGLELNAGPDLFAQGQLRNASQLQTNNQRGEGGLAPAPEPTLEQQVIHLKQLKEQLVRQASGPSNQGAAACQQSLGAVKKKLDELLEEQWRQQGLLHQQQQQQQQGQEILSGQGANGAGLAQAPLLDVVGLETISEAPGPRKSSSGVPKKKKQKSFKNLNHLQDDQQFVRPGIDPKDDAAFQEAMMMQNRKMLESKWANRTSPMHSSRVAAAAAAAAAEGKVSSSPPDASISPPSTPPASAPAQAGMAEQQANIGRVPNTQHPRPAVSIGDSRPSVRTSEQFQPARLLSQSTSIFPRKAVVNAHLPPAVAARLCSQNHPDQESPAPVRTSLHMPGAPRVPAPDVNAQPPPPPPVFKGIVLRQPSNRSSTSHHAAFAAKQAQRLQAL